MAAWTCARDLSSERILAAMCSQISACLVIDGTGTPNRDLGNPGEHRCERERLCVHDGVNQQCVPPIPEAGVGHVGQEVAIGRPDGNIRVRSGVRIDRLRDRDPVDSQEFVCAPGQTGFDLTGTEHHAKDLRKHKASGNEHAVHDWVDGEVLALLETRCQWGLVRVRGGAGGEDDGASGSAQDQTVDWRPALSQSILFHVSTRESAGVSDAGMARRERTIGGLAAGCRSAGVSGAVT